MTDRAANRRRLKADLKAIAHGLDVTGRDNGQIASLMRVFHDQTRQAIRERSLSPLMEFVYESFTLSERRVADAPVACAKGCSHCCRIWVSANAAELIFLVKSLDNKQLPQFQLSVQEAFEVTKGKTFDERGRMVTPCPLLVGDLCGIHPVRPLVCRSGASANAQICERAFRQLTYEVIPIPAVYVSMRLAYTLAFAGALRRAGLIYDVYEFNDALTKAFAAPDAESEWLAGKDPFDGVQRDTGNIFDNPVYQQLYDAAFA